MTARFTAKREIEGLRVIAVFEIVKGALVLLAGFGLLRLIHHDVQHAADRFIHDLRLNPAHGAPRVFLELAGRLNDSRLWILAGAALAYALIRFVEGYGLWKARRWAEWMGALGSGLYLPLEIWHLRRGITVGGILLVAANVAIVVYLVWILWRQQQRSKTASSS